MTAIADRIFVCVGDRKKGSDRKSLIFEEKNGRILSELTKPTDTRWYTYSITVCVQLGVVAVVWHGSYYRREGIRYQIVFYSLLSENNSSFLIVEIESGVTRIRISDRGDRMVTMNPWTGEVKVYDMAELFTYSHFKERLASSLQTDECTRLANYLKIPKDQTDNILSSDTPSENLLLALEEKGVLQPYSVDRLTEAFREVNIDTLCLHLAEFYQKTRVQSTSYGRFLATLSAHLTASLPGDLCDYFNISDEKKISITSSQNPGLSLFLTLDEMGIIKVSEVGALEEPFSQMQLVQAVAKAHEYQSMVEEAESFLQKKEKLTEEEKKDLFIQGLQKKIKSWYETMTPVPWKKSCRWRSTDLFIGCSLILTEVKPRTTSATGDADTHVTDIKMQYTEIFSHERLKSELRIILEGDPGSGKTMLMSQLAYDWCQGKFNDIEILILLPLKFVEQKTIVQSIKDLYFSEDERLSVNDIGHFLLNGEYSKCLLLDGLEEYNGKVTEGEQCEVIQIMSKVKYPTCKVVISSRSNYAQNLLRCTKLRVAKLSDNERNSYIQKVFPENSQKQMDVREFIESSLFILDLCSTPLFLVMVVHNIASLAKLKIAEINTVSPLVKRIINALCSVGGLMSETEESGPRVDMQDEIVLAELAYNGLCRGYQQLHWPKEFIESKVSSIKDWIDSGVLIVEESVTVRSLVKRMESTVDVVNDTEQGDDSEKLGAGAEPGPDTDSEVRPANIPDSSEVQITTPLGSYPTARYVPLQVKFAHKMIQEWFAAKYLFSMMSEFRNEDYLQKHLREILPLINPSDLHFLLYFMVFLYPPSCHIILKYLLNSSHTVEGYLPEHIMDYIFICFAEYDGENEHGILEAVADVWKEEISVNPNDSRLVTQAKVAMLELASDCGVMCRKLSLADIVVSASGDTLHLKSDTTMKVLDTLEVLELSDCGGRLTKRDCENVLKFVEKCAWIKKACLYISKQPPKIDKEVLVSLRESDKTVTWIMGSEQKQILDTTTGEWMPMEVEENLPRAETDSDDGWGEEPILQVEETISKEGGPVEIPETGVKLDIPPHALQEDIDQCNICMKIVPPDVSDWSVTDYVSNSSVIVELLPNNLTFQQPFRLTLPHCLQLKKGVEHKATIFVSHHEEGTYPSWEEKTDAQYELTETTCTILLDSFCWVKYVINGETVEAQRVQVFAAGRSLSPTDTIYETELGFFPDTPGAGEKFRSSRRLSLASKNTFLLYKKGEHPLKFLVQRIIPSEWVYVKDKEKPEEIPFEFIDQSKESSCPFIFAKQSEKPLFPRFEFRALQGDRGIRLRYRPKVQDDDDAYTQTD